MNNAYHQIIQYLLLFWGMWLKTNTEIKCEVSLKWLQYSINQQAESLTKGPDGGPQPSQYDQDQSYRSGHPTPTEDAHPWTSWRTETYVSVQDESVYLKK